MQIYFISKWRHLQELSFAKGGLHTPDKLNSIAALADEALRRLDGRLLKYAVRRETDENGSPIEVVLGKDGRLMVLEDRVIVMAGGKEAFSAPLETVKSGELMSLDGVVVSGRDDVTGTYATVVGFYI